MSEYENDVFQGLSLIEQARKLKPKDLASRNIKCIKVRFHLHIKGAFILSDIDI